MFGAGGEPLQYWRARTANRFFIWTIRFDASTRWKRFYYYFFLFIFPMDLIRCLINIYVKWINELACAVARVSTQCMDINRPKSTLSSSIPFALTRSGIMEAIVFDLCAAKINNLIFHWKVRAANRFRCGVWTHIRLESVAARNERANCDSNQHLSHFRSGFLGSLQQNAPKRRPIPISAWATKKCAAILQFRVIFFSFRFGFLFGQTREITDCIL